MTSVETSPESLRAPETVLAFLHTLLESAGEPLTAILQGLGEAFGADGVGLAILSSHADSAKAPVVLAESHWPTFSAVEAPWEKKPGFVTQLKANQGSLVLADADGNSWAAATVQNALNPWVLWLMG